jgi:hypothetical protein
VGHGLQAQQDARERLVGLVVQVAREARALRLLGAQDGAGAGAALVLDAVEHAVERLAQAHDVLRVGALGVRAHAGVERSTRSMVAMSSSSGAKRRRRTTPLTSTVARIAAARTRNWRSPKLGEVEPAATLAASTAVTTRAAG